MIAGEPLQSVDNKLIIVDTEAAVALGSGILAVAFVVELGFPGVLCEPAATEGPAAFDNLLRSSLTKPEKKLQ